MIRSGLKRDEVNERKEAWKETVAAGTTIMAGFGAAALIKEKKIDPEKYQQV